MTYRMAVLLEDYSVLGGVEKVSANLVDAFLAHNIPVWGIVSLNSKNKEPLITYPKVPIFVSNQKQFIFSKLAENNVNILIIQISWQLGLFLNFTLFFKQRGIKVICVLHNTPYLWTKKWDNRRTNSIWGNTKLNIHILRHRILLKKLANTCDRFLLLSEHCRQEFDLLTSNCCSANTDFMYNVIPQPKKEANLVKKRNWLVYAGRLAPIKRVFLTVRLLHPILRKNPDWIYYILGDGEEFEQIKDYIITHKIDNIKLMGAVDNVEEYLNLSKISLLYSLYEGLPTSLLEAKLYHNVLVCSNSHGGVIDIMNENSDFIVNNDQEFIKIVGDLLSDSRKLDSLLLTACLNEKFSEDRIIDKWKILFCDL